MSERAVRRRSCRVQRGMVASGSCLRSSATMSASNVRLNFETPVTLCGPAAEKDAVLDGLQSVGCLHLNDLRPGASDVADPGASQSDARQALQHLWDSLVRRQPLQQKDNVDVEAVAKETLEVRDHSRALAEEREQRRKWIADLEPWGNFDLPEWAMEGPLRF
jgi:V/A-type H+-transporting ATPase subunit I